MDKVKASASMILKYLLIKKKEKGKQDSVMAQHK